jgi:Homeodomain-like domain
MPTPLSMDLRIRVLAWVAQGLSHRQVGERFGVSAASVSRWRALEREQGEARARPMGGDRRSERIEAHKDTILTILEAKSDIAIGELRDALGGEGRCCRPRHDPPLLRPLWIERAIVAFWCVSIFLFAFGYLVNRIKGTRSEPPMQKPRMKRGNALNFRPVQFTASQ